MQTKNGYPIWVPLAGTALLLIFAGSIIAAIATRDWRYLIATAVSFWIFGRA